MRTLRRLAITTLAALSCAQVCVASDGVSKSPDDTAILDVRSGMTRYDWSWLAASFDENQNGVVEKAELPVAPEDFAKLDRNWDLELTEADFDWSLESPLTRQKETVFALFKSADTNSDGRMQAEELQAVFTKQAGEKGYLNEEELEQLIYVPKVLKARAEAKNRHLHVDFLEDDDGRLPSNLPAPCAVAPDFELQNPDNSQKIRLSSFRGKQPVVLVFGCLTCGNYRTYSETLEKMYLDRKADVQFLRVYVREAHPVNDRGVSETNKKAGILIRQPKTIEERCDVAGRCAVDLNLQTPMVVDGIDNAVGRAYGGWPDRLYIIDVDGNVVYQGGPGPFAFNPKEMEQSLILTLLDQRQRSQKSE
ncbi:MAG: deiodinase family protein [Planctomycetaceae bacterium]